MCSIKFSDLGQLNHQSFSMVFGNKRVVQYACVLTNVGLLGPSMKWPLANDGGREVKPTKLVFKYVGGETKVHGYLC